MHRPIPGAAVLGAATLALASTLTAQQSAQTPQQPIFRSGVELVQVDVVVVDQDGKHVRGLKAADFAVLDHDKPQTIATFEEVSHERPAEAAPAPLLTRPARLGVGNNQAARSDRLVVMVIDDLHIYKRDAGGGDCHQVIDPLSIHRLKSLSPPRTQRARRRIIGFTVSKPLTARTEDAEKKTQPFVLSLRSLRAPR